VKQREARHGDPHYRSNTRRLIGSEQLIHAHAERPSCQRVRSDGVLFGNPLRLDFGPFLYTSGLPTIILASRPVFPFRYRGFRSLTDLERCFLFGSGSSKCDRLFSLGFRLKENRVLRNPLGCVAKIWNRRSTRVKNEIASPAFEDIKVHVRVKLSALWSSLMFLYIYGDYFELYQPGKLQQMVAGRTGLGAVSQSALLSMSALMAIPSLMGSLCLVLPAGVIAGQMCCSVSDTL